jgi:predicted DsbA family dithiol-disulfide isomerase
MPEYTLDELGIDVNKFNERMSQQSWSMQSKNEQKLQQKLDIEI